MKLGSPKLYQKLSQNKIRCLACQRKCLILPGKTGFCLARENRKGSLYSLTYGLITGIQADPVEKKPLYHFHPGAAVASIGSFGCNFRCKQCLNWSCSWGEPATGLLQKLTKERAGRPASEEVNPKSLVKTIKDQNYPGLAFTYNEPAINPEFVHDAAKLAKKEKLFTVFVTNGSWTTEALDYYGQYIDAANIDFKGFSQKIYSKQGGFFGQIPALAKYAQEKHHIHLEITTLLIPTINDQPEELKKMANWMVKNLGPKTPWHLSQYSPAAAPDKEFAKIPPTTIEALAKAAVIGRQAGLQFVYVWAPAADYAQADTICPKCGNLAIHRTGYKIEVLGVNKNGHCSKCGENLNIRLT